jgi:TRAP-type uncharacterized transport system substrate-binding protein
MGSVAIADTIRIGVGQPGRGYEAHGMKIGDRLDDSEVVNFAGSDEISRALCDGDIDIGIMQNDAKYQRSLEGCKLRSVGEYPNKEFAFILFPEGSSFNELDDLRESNKILVDEIGSGTDLFWTTIKQIETEHGRGSNWMNANRVNDMFLFADAMAAEGSIDALVYVGDPNSQEIWDFLSAGWEVGELYDKDINDMKVNGESLYTRETVTIDPPGRWNTQKEDAYVVRSFIVARTDWLAEDRSRARDVAQAVKAAQ